MHLQVTPAVARSSASTNLTACPLHAAANRTRTAQTVIVQTHKAVLCLSACLSNWCQLCCMSTGRAELLTLDGDGNSSSSTNTSSRGDRGSTVSSSRGDSHSHSHRSSSKGSPLKHSHARNSKTEQQSHSTTTASASAGAGSPSAHNGSSSVPQRVVLAAGERVQVSSGFAHNLLEEVCEHCRLHHCKCTRSQCANVLTGMHQ
jgi:hypothetical protein